jgi:arylsulfatase A-like enzyme
LRLNQIVIILDSLRKDHLGTYGNSWIKTPIMDNFAHDALVFENAYPESLPTLPVRRALMTGIRTFPYRDYMRYKGDHVATFGWGPIPQDQTTIPELFQQGGYTTAFITDTYHQFKPSMNFHRGFHQFTWIRGQESDCYKSGGDSERIDSLLDQHLFSKPQSTFSKVHLLEKYFKNTALRKSEEDYFAAQVFRESITWLEENADERPFLLWIDSFDPHEPWDPPQSYFNLYFHNPNYLGGKIIWPQYINNLNGYTSEELEYMRAAYAGEVTMVDHWLGVFLSKVHTLGLDSDTMISIISDHGHQLGEHQFTGKVPYGLYPELIDLVLMIKKPEQNPRRIPQLVYNLDLAPTLLNASFPGTKKSQIMSSILANMDGRDLYPLFNPETIPSWQQRDHISIGFSNFVFVRNNSFGYITSVEHKKEELYDMNLDPQMLNNIAKTHPKTCQLLYDYVVQDAGGSSELIRIGNLHREAQLKADEWYRLS